MSSAELKQHIEHTKRVKEVREAMEVIVNATNTMGTEDEVVRGMVEGIENCHRTLQQSFMRCFAEAMKEYGDTRFFDARNEASVKFAKKIGEMEEYFPFI